MSIYTHERHLGFTVHSEELELDQVLAMNSKTWQALKETQSKVDWEFSNLRQEVTDLQGLLATANAKLEAKKSAAEK